MEERRINRGGESDARIEAESEPQRPHALLVDSNGRGATPDSIRNHIPREERGKYKDITVQVAYTTDEAVRRVGEDIDVRNAVVVVDCLTNDVRGTRQRPAASPAQLVQRVDRLRKRPLAAGAAAIVVCQVKPMEVCDVRPHSEAIHEYLKSAGPNIYGSRTQIRRHFLQKDGFHIRPQFDGILDRTYACAIMGEYVPCPTPAEDFVPEFARRNFPRLPGAYDRWDQREGGGNRMNVHGWRS